MSFRYYPRYIAGNPQLRIFLPNFWMKLVKPRKESPPNYVTFKVPLEMTDVDVKNYLEKIYKVPVVHVKTKVYSGDLRKTHKNYLIKDDDYRLAFVTLPVDQKFVFPKLFPEDKVNKELEEQRKIKEQLESQVHGLQKQREKNKDRLDVPSWFGI